MLHEALKEANERRVVDVALIANLEHERIKSFYRAIIEEYAN